MTKNKSIDGLTIRDAKTPAHQISAAKTTAKKVPSAKKTIHIKADSTKIEVKSVPSNAINHEQVTEDFLSPVQAFDFNEATGELEATKPDSKKASPEKNQKTKKEKKKPSKVRRIISVITLIIVIALIGLISWAVFWGNDIIAKITGGQGNVFDLMTFIEPTYEPLKTDANGRTNILAFGTSGYNMDGDEGNGTHAGAQLTDSIMMISLNQETGDIAMLSLPRDLKASPTCTATGKINEVYWCHNMYGEDEAAGATALMAEVGSILGVDFQYYAHLNWGSLISIVDILGGINITLDEDIDDYYWTGAVYQAGVTYTINGEQALGLARARHGTIGGDFSRGASQQKILVGIKDKIFEKDLSITDILGLATTLGDNFRSNFSVEEIKSAAHLTFDFDFDSMRQISLYPDYMTTGTVDGISYVLPRAGINNYGAIQAYVAENLSNDPRVYEHPIIAIFNSTNTAGLAATEKTRLEEAGYTVTSIDNTPEDIYFDADYTIYTNNTKPGTEDLLEKFYNNIKLKPISELPAGLPTDYDFVIILGGQEKDENSESES